MQDSPLQKLLRENREDILALGKQYGITNIRVFGSVVRGEDTEDSDIDFLVHLKENHSILDVCGFRLKLVELLGRDIDVVEERNLYWFIKPDVLAGAKPL